MADKTDAAQENLGEKELEERSDVEADGRGGEGPSGKANVVEEGNGTSAFLLEGCDDHPSEQDAGVTNCGRFCEMGNILIVSTYTEQHIHLFFGANWNLLKIHYCCLID